MADREDARMHPMQPPARDPAADRARAQAQTTQLMQRNDVVLPAGDLRDRVVEREVPFKTSTISSF